MDPEVKRTVKGIVSYLYNTTGDEEPKPMSLGVEILKVAYAYDSMTAMNFEEEPASEITALRHLLNVENGYDQQIVSALVESINILQPGVCIEFTDGERGLVVVANDADVLSPVILSFHDNVLYNMADSSISAKVQIKDIMRTMDNRHVMDNELLKSYMGNTVHLGEKRAKKNY